MEPPSVAYNRRYLTFAKGVYGISVQRITYRELVRMNDTQLKYLIRSFGICDPEWIYPRWLYYLLDMWMRRPRSRIYLAVKVPYQLDPNTGMPEVLGLVMCGSFFKRYMTDQGYSDLQFSDTAINPDSLFQIYALCKASGTSGPLARILMAYALQYADESRLNGKPRYQNVVLDVAFGEKNARAMSLYRDMDFRPTEFSYTVDDSSTKTQMLMVKHRAGSFLSGMDRWLVLPAGATVDVVGKACNV